MTTRKIEQRETFCFDTADDLRKWLNQFKQTDLTAVAFIHDDDDRLHITWETEVLSDGSKVNTIVIG